jgi:hypothetical protein
MVRLEHVATRQTFGRRDWNVRFVSEADIPQGRNLPGEFRVA